MVKVKCIFQNYIQNIYAAIIKKFPLSNCIMLFFLGGCFTCLCSSKSETSNNFSHSSISTTSSSRTMISSSLKSSKYLKCNISWLTSSSSSAASFISCTFSSKDSLSIDFKEESASSEIGSMSFSTDFITLSTTVAEAEAEAGTGAGTGSSSSIIISSSTTFSWMVFCCLLLAFTLFFFPWTGLLAEVLPILILCDDSVP